MRILACLLLTALGACSIDNIRQQAESTPAIMAEALDQQKIAVEDGCLATIFDGKPIADLMASNARAKSVPVSQSGSPTATAAWKIGSSNETFVMQLPNGACSASTTLGDPQQLHDAALAMAQKRGAFKAGKVDKSERGDAERTAYCTAGPNPYVVVIYKRTTGSRAAFLANIFKAQGAQFSACNP